MAVVTRYFDVAGNGAADGTSWADRAPLFTAGAWSTIITAFNFTTDSLQCFIGPGNYTCSSSLNAGAFSTVQPAVNAGLLYLFACDSSGVRWQPDYTWKSCQPAAWVSELPQITHTSNGVCIGQNGTNCLGLSVIRTNAAFAANTSPFATSNVIEWCHAEVHADSTAASAFSSGLLWGVANCVGRVTGTSFGGIFNGITSATTFLNCRAEGNAAAASGTRAGFLTAANGLFTVQNCTAFDCETGISNSNSAAARLSAACNTVRCNATGTGLLVGSAVSANSGPDINKNFVVADTGVRLTQVHSGGVHHNRIRATTPLSVAADQIEYDNETTAGSDVDEFVDSANGDFRIKYGSAYWGLCYGAGDEPAPAGGVTTHNPFRSRAFGARS